MAAPLNQPALVKDEDIAAKPAGGKAVGNVNGCFVPDNLIEMGIDLKLGKGVQGGGGLIQNDERRIFVKRPGKGDFLCLAAGNFHSVLLKILVKYRVQPLGHPVHPIL